MIKLIDLLLVTEEKTKIQAFIDNDEIGIFYYSPFSSALMKKKHYNITRISVINNQLSLHLKYNTYQDNNYNHISLFDLLSIVSDKNYIKIFFNNILITTEQEYLHYIIKKIIINDNLINIIL